MSMKTFPKPTTKRDIDGKKPPQNSGWWRILYKPFFLNSLFKKIITSKTSSPSCILNAPTFSRKRRLKSSSSQGGNTPHLGDQCHAKTPPNWPLPGKNGIKRRLHTLPETNPATLNTTENRPSKAPKVDVFVVHLNQTLNFWGVAYFLIVFGRIRIFVVHRFKLVRSIIDWSIDWSIYQLPTNLIRWIYYIANPEIKAQNWAGIYNNYSK